MNHSSKDYLVNLFLSGRDLGRNKTAIDLGCSNLTAEQMREIERECNDLIKNHVDVKVHVYDSNKDPELQNVSCYCQRRHFKKTAFGRLFIILVAFGLLINFMMASQNRTQGLISVPSHAPHALGTRLF